LGKTERKGPWILADLKEGPSGEKWGRGKEEVYKQPENHRGERDNKKKTTM